MKRLVWVLAVLMFSLTILASAQAAVFSTVFSAVDNEILPNETAVFELTISNFEPTEQRFQVYSIDPNWIVSIKPLPVNVESGSSGVYTVTLKPKTNIGLGSTGIAINVKNLESGDLVRKQLVVAVKSYESARITFEPSVAFDITMPNVIDPREPQQVSIRVRNRNNLDIENMTLLLQSPHISEETTLDLGPVGEATEWFKMTFDPLESPEDYTLKGKLIYDDAVINEVQKSYTVSDYSTITEAYEKTPFLFRIEKTVTLKNVGNVAADAEAAFTTNFFSKLFTSSEPEAEYQKGPDGAAFVWVVTLGPDEEVTLTVVENYRWLMITIVVLFLLVALYYIYRSPVVSLKEVVGITKGEGVSEIKIRVFVKNRSNRIIQGLEVLDKVPSIAELTKTHVLGTVKPTKVTKVKSGTLLRWNLDVFEPYEERILTYSVKSKLKIVGRLSLPQAKIKFETRKGQERVVYSNNILFNEKK